MLDVKTTTIYRWLNDPENDFPQPIRLGPKMVRWHQSELEEWLANRERGIQEINLETPP